MMAAIKPYFERLKADMAADKKKTAILGGLSLVLLVVVGRMVLPGGETTVVTANTSVLPTGGALPVADNALIPVQPATNASGAPPIAVTPRRVESINQMPTRRSASVDNDTQPLMTKPTVAPTVEADVVLRLPDVPARDPFDATGWRRRFGVRQVATTEPGQAVGALSFMSELAHRVSTYQTEQARLSVQLDDELAQLELRSTLTGSTKSAYISGQLVKEGDEIAGFSVVRIEPGRVILSKHGIQRQLSVP